MAQASEIDRAWAAGFFDGEGCVNIRSSRERYFNLTIIVAQKVEAPLVRFAEIVGSAAKIGTTRRFNRNYFRLTLCGSEAATALEMMLPHLTVKRDVAEAGVSLQRLVDSGRGRSLSTKSVARRKELADKVAWLNTGRWAAAETKSSGSRGEHPEGCDSPSCNYEKVAESGGNVRAAG